MRISYTATVVALVMANACSSDDGGQTDTVPTVTNPSPEPTAPFPTGGPINPPVGPTGAPPPATQPVDTGTPTVTPQPTPTATPSGTTSTPTPTPTATPTVVTPGPTPTEVTPTSPEPSSGPGPSTPTEPDPDVIDTGADEKFSFFVTSYYHLAELSGSPDGFGGDLRYKGAATGLEGADAICQEIGRRVGFGHRTWRAYLSTSTVNAIDRIGSGPWYDHQGVKVADSPQELISGANRQPGGCCDIGTYDEMGLFHDGKTDQNNDGIDDDDHDTMTATLADGTYAGFSCDDWTSTTATSTESGGNQGGGQQGGGAPGGGGFGGFGGGFGGFDLNTGIMMGHSWPAQSGRHWAQSHAGHQCKAGTNFIQDGFGDGSTVGGGGGYGGFYCFALAE
jgi:hypothetical protein